MKLMKLDDEFKTKVEKRTVDGWLYKLFTCVRQAISFSQKDLEDLEIQLLGNAIGSLVIKVVSIGLTVLIPFVLSRWLGAEGYGTYAYAVAWATIWGGVAVLGLDLLAIREVASARTQARWGLLRGIITWSLSSILIISFVFMGLLTTLFWLLQSKLPPAVMGALWIAVPIIPFLALIRFFQGSLQGLGRVLLAQWPQLILLPGGILILATAFYLIQGQLQGTSAVTAYLCSAVIACAVGGIALWRTLNCTYPQASLQVEASRWIQSAVPLFLAGLVSLANERIGVLVLGTFAGPEAAGIFDVAYKGSLLVAFPLGAVNMVLAPLVSSLYSKGDQPALQRVVTISARVTFILALLIAVLLIFFSRYILQLLGAEFIQGKQALMLLILGQLINVGAGSVGFILAMSGHEREMLKAMLTAFLFHSIFAIFLVPIYTINGAAIAAVISLGVWNGMMAGWVWKKIGINPSILRIGMW